MKNCENFVTSQFLAQLQRCRFTHRRRPGADQSLLLRFRQNFPGKQIRQITTKNKTIEQKNKKAKNIWGTNFEYFVNSLLWRWRNFERKWNSCNLKKDLFATLKKKNFEIGQKQEIKSDSVWPKNSRNVKWSEILSLKKMHFRSKTTRFWSFWVLMQIF